MSKSQNEVPHTSELTSPMADEALSSANALREIRKAVELRILQAQMDQIQSSPDSLEATIALLNVDLLALAYELGFELRQAVNAGGSSLSSFLQLEPAIGLQLRLANQIQKNSELQLRGAGKAKNCKSDTHKRSPSSSPDFGSLLANIAGRMGPLQ